MLFFTVSLLGGNYSITSNWGFSMTTWSPPWITESDNASSSSHRLRTFPLILTSYSVSFHLISLDSHCIFTSVTSLLAPSICPTLAVGGAYLYQAVAVPQSFLLDVLSCQSLGLFIISSRKITTGETPASLKLTVSFPASFLLNTMCTLLAFLIINSQGPVQQE